MNKNLIVIIALLEFSTMTEARDFYVAAQGNDQWDGSAPMERQQGTVGPFQSLSRAQLAVRELKKTSQFSQAITIHIEAGDYTLQKPLEFDLRDTGFADRPIRWQGEHGPVHISGGIELTQCEAGDSWHCHTGNLNLDSIKYPNAERKKGNIPGFELFVDDQRLHLARWPNDDWAHIRQPLDEKTRFSSLEALPAIDAQTQRIQVHIMAGNDWFDQFIGVQSIDSVNNQISLSTPTSYALSSGRRYYLQNIESQLDAPGEWFYNPGSKDLAFMPPSGQTPRRIVASASPQLLQIKGANHLIFDSLQLAHCTGNAIDIHQSHHIELNRLDIGNIGGRAIMAREINDFSLSNSHLHHTGEGGILVSGGNRKTLQSANNRIHNNHIEHFGETILTYSAAIELYGVGSQATHNLLEYAAGNAIQFTGNDHLLEKNEIHHVCEQASDCGAVYTGRDWSFHGNIIRYNSIHDLSGYGMKSVDLANNRVVYSKADGVRGIYLDDAVSGITVHGNLLRNAGQMAIQLGGGRHNTLTNNIIISNTGYAIWVDNRWPGYDWSKNQNNLKQVPYQDDVWRQRYPALAEPMHNHAWPEGNIIQHNILINESSTTPMLRYQMPQYSNTLTDNLAWSPAGHFSVDFNILDHLQRGSAPWQQWLSEGIEKNSLFADPCLTITGNRSTLCANSPASKIGFQALPGDIGLIR